MKAPVYSAVLSDSQTGNVKPRLHDTTCCHTG